ncbi:MULTISPECIES: hypothetical protein [Weeksella]|uniref:hypothetical protein n=1 Tax=Weeksella TaxID=1013 RepID=UPI0008A20A13|nr:MULTISPECIES: hypothetical protein [Weeksella]MDK7375989.1 hypothetical protein [Weeksella virosa]OFM84583.1 hypothetical protein HMPREF2660_08715 [Weeksella sp. HMSC059D05]
MIDVIRLYEYGQEIKAADIGVNRFRMVDTPDKLVEELKDFNKESNHLLIIVLPSHNAGKSTSFDDLAFNNVTQFYVLEKYDSRAYVDNFEEMKIFQRTQDTMRKLLEKIRNDQETDSQYCDILNQISVASMQLDPIRHISDTLGYVLTFSF